MRMDGLTLFGVASLSVMLLCYALERKSPWFTFGMASACVAAGIYGFLQGAWPFAVIESHLGRNRLSPLVAGPVDVAGDSQGDGCRVASSLKSRVRL